MNERIRELAVQAGFQSYITTHEEDVAMFEKFAELIVKDCVVICKNQEHDYWQVCNDRYFTPQDCADAIQQYFGVEE